MKLWPALDVRGGDDFLLAVLDDFAPTALAEVEHGVRAFFAARESRDAARAGLADRGIPTDPIDVPDEDWAVRSQQNLAPVTVGRITVVPDVGFPLPASGSDISVLIRASMGFGTGHHATTRLCLAALQTLDLRGTFVLDVGTGSGILAIAAARLGAARALGLDHDPDAIQSAGENLQLNPQARHVQFAVADLVATSLPRAEVVVANLTGTLLACAAASLVAAVRPAGTLIVSGLLADEEGAVRRAFPGAEIARQQEEEWVCLAITNLTGNFRTSPLVS